MKKTVLILTAATTLWGCSLTTPVAATANPIGTKMGKSTAVSILGICLNGDASIITAAQNGGITKITTVDYRKRNYLGIVLVHECLVNGD